VIEFARNECHLEEANSTEFAKECKHPVIDFVADQRKVDQMGGTMRLGLYPAKLVKGSLARSVYGADLIYERHRHRYEVNNTYRKRLQDAGMIFSGLSPDEGLVETIELKNHPFFLACQYHPEFTSRPTQAHPLFRSFVAACLTRRRERTAK
jgi:CTP synthase